MSGYPFIAGQELKRIGRVPTWNKGHNALLWWAEKRCLPGLIQQDATIEIIMVVTGLSHAAIEHLN